MQTIFERGVVVLSIDTEQIWGYLDSLSEAQFERRYPNAPAVHDRLLECLRAAELRATWLLVGGMVLEGSSGLQDPRFRGLPSDWVRRIVNGCERTAPRWFRPSFVKRLRAARPVQEIGLHGGLTHLVWNRAQNTPDQVRRELSEGVNALKQAGVYPGSFSFSRNEEAYHELLVAHGIRCFRGRPPALAWRLGRTLSGALLRAAEELRCTAPPLVWPRQHVPGLWNIPASMFLYPIGSTRARIIRLRSRLERFRRGLETTARFRAIFHFCLHPENLAESPQGFLIFEEMLAALISARDRGDIEVMAMADVVNRIEKDKEYVPGKHLHSYKKVFEANRRL